MRSLLCLIGAVLALLSCTHASLTSRHASYSRTSASAYSASASSSLPSSSSSSSSPLSSTIKYVTLAETTSFARVTTLVTHPSVLAKHAKKRMRAQAATTKGSYPPPNTPYSIPVNATVPSDCYFTSFGPNRVELGDTTLPNGVGPITAMVRSIAGLIVGTSNGGLWRTSSSFSSPQSVAWFPIEGLKCSSISTLVKSLDDDRVLAAGCGSMSTLNIDSDWWGIVWSVDGGYTWSAAPFPYGEDVSSLLIFGSPSSFILYATTSRTKLQDTWEIEDRGQLYVSTCTASTKSTCVFQTLSTTTGIESRSFFSLTYLSPSTILLGYFDFAAANQFFIDSTTFDRSEPTNLTFSHTSSSAFLEYNTITPQAPCPGFIVSKSVVSVREQDGTVYVGLSSVSTSGTKHCFVVYYARTITSEWQALSGLTPGSNGVSELGLSSFLHFTLLGHPTNNNALWVAGSNRAIFFVTHNGSSATWSPIATTTSINNMRYGTQVMPTTPPASSPSGSCNGSRSCTAPHPNIRTIIYDSLSSSLLAGTDGGLFARSNPHLPNPVLQPGDWQVLNGNLSNAEVLQAAFYNNVFIAGVNGVGVMINNRSDGLFTSQLADGNYVAIDTVSQPAQLYGADNFMNTVFQMSTDRIISTDNKDALVQIVLRESEQSMFPVGFWNKLTPISANTQVANKLFLCGTICFDLTVNEVNVDIVLYNSTVGGRFLSYVAGGRRNGVTNPNITVAVSTTHLWTQDGTTSKKTDLTELTHNQQPLQIAVDPDNYHNIFFTTSEGKVYGSQDFGVSFSDVTQESVLYDFYLELNHDPSRCVWGITVIPFSSVDGYTMSAVLLGTNRGLYVSFAQQHFDGWLWNPIGYGIPNALITSLQYDKYSRRLTVATVGRGIYYIDNFDDLLRAVADGLSQDEGAGFQCRSIITTPSSTGGVAPSSTASPAPNNEKATFNMTLSADYSTFTADPNIVSLLKNDIATLLGINSLNIQINTLRAGSVFLSFNVFSTSSAAVISLPTVISTLINLVATPSSLSNSRLASIVPSTFTYTYTCSNGQTVVNKNSCDAADGSNDITTIIGVILGSIAGVGIVLLIIYFVRRRPTTTKLNADTALHGEEFHGVQARELSESRPNVNTAATPSREGGGNWAVKPERSTTRSTHSSSAIGVAREPGMITAFQTHNPTSANGTVRIHRTPGVAGVELGQVQNTPRSVSIAPPSQSHVSVSRQSNVILNEGEEPEEHEYLFGGDDEDGVFDPNSVSQAGFHKD